MGCPHVPLNSGSACGLENEHTLELQVVLQALDIALWRRDTCHGPPGCILRGWPPNHAHEIVVHRDGSAARVEVQLLARLQVDGGALAAGHTPVGLQHVRVDDLVVAHVYLAHAQQHLQRCVGDAGGRLTVRRAALGRMGHVFKLLDMQSSNRNPNIGCKGRVWELVVVVHSQQGTTTVHGTCEG